MPKFTPKPAGSISTPSIDRLRKALSLVDDEREKVGTLTHELNEAREILNDLVDDAETIIETQRKQAATTARNLAAANGDPLAALNETPDCPMTGFTKRARQFLNRGEA